MSRSLIREIRVDRRDGFRHGGNEGKKQPKGALEALNERINRFSHRLVSLKNNHAPSSQKHAHRAVLP
jgi:hypothetical protein